MARRAGRRRRTLAAAALRRRTRPRGSNWAPRTPAGSRQFITGKTTLLSSLIRDELALRTAKLAAARSPRRASNWPPCAASTPCTSASAWPQWQFERVDFCAPILLRPLAIRRYGSDFELRLLGDPFLNPELARALDEQFRIRLDADAFVALAEQDGTFKPNPGDRPAARPDHAPGMVQRVPASGGLVVRRCRHRDAGGCGEPGPSGARRAGRQPDREMGGRGELLPGRCRRRHDQRAPGTDTLLLDADAEQENVVAQIAAGNSVVVKTLPGTGGTQTIVNAIGALVTANKRVLVVGPRRSSLTGIAQRLARRRPGRHRGVARARCGAT